MNAWRRWNPIRPIYNFSRAAFLNGPKLKGDWNVNITDAKQSYFATIHRAANDYYYNTPLGLQTPPKFTWEYGKIAIAAYLRPGNNHHQGYFNAIVGTFFGGGSLGVAIFGADRPKIDIYATTIHELGHASHWNLRGRNHYYFGVHTRCELRETWATAVEWAITSKVYGELQNKPTFSYGDFQSYSRNIIAGGYTPLMIDLIDSFNQFFSLEPDTYPNDNVSGFSITDCENALRGNVNNFGDFYQRLVSTPVAQSQLGAFDILFSFYYSINYTCGGNNQQPQN
jgi:hypothetical protein